MQKRTILMATSAVVAVVIAGLLLQLFWKPLKGAVGFLEPETEGEKNEAIFTAYTPSAAETDGDPRIMASGRQVYVGAVACPSHLDFGTRIRIEGIGGTYTCEDRMAARYRNRPRFDILMNERERAIRFGVQKLAYRIIDTPGDEQEN